MTAPGMPPWAFRRRNVSAHCDPEIEEGHEKASVRELGERAITRIDMDRVITPLLEQHHEAVGSLRIGAGDQR